MFIYYLLLFIIKNPWVLTIEYGPQTHKFVLMFPPSYLVFINNKCYPTNRVIETVILLVI